jgi:homocysteine S-methyltransferase
MQKNALLELINKGQPVLADGAMGTMINQKGISFDENFELLNLTQPALIADIHREYIEAGAQIITSNTFGANRFKLKLCNINENVRTINLKSVELLRRVILASFKDVLIAGDVGPLGVRLAPFGRTQVEEAEEVYREQISYLIEAGVDMIVIETMTDLYETLAAIRAAKSLSSDIPVLASMTYTRDDTTLLGDSPAKVAKALQDEGADIVGANCSGGPNQLLRIIRKMRAAVPDATISAMPNAGWPERIDGRIMYTATPDYFGDYAKLFWEAGATIIGGCCGTTPDHIASMRKALFEGTIPNRKVIEPAAVSLEDDIEGPEAPTELQRKFAEGHFVITVEMDPPKGLSTKKILAGASLLAEAGADTINVADSPMARMRMSPWAVCSLIQRKLDIETVLHFPTRGRNLIRVQGDLLAAHALDVRNIFVVMGDPTAIGDYPDATDHYDLVPSGLVKLIKQQFNAGLDKSGAEIGKPTSFHVGCALNLNPGNIDREIKTLNRKILAGADFALTQPIYEPEKGLTFLKRYEDTYGPLPIPIVVGILPLASARHAAFLQEEVPGIDIPEAIHQRMRDAGDQARKTGIEIAIELSHQVKPFAHGIYLMPAFKRYEDAAEIIESVRKSS